MSCKMFSYNINADFKGSFKICSPNSQTDKQLEFALFSNISRRGVDGTDVVAQQVAGRALCQC